MQINRGKQQNRKDYRCLQENQRSQGNISWKDGHNKGQKWYGPSEAADYEEVARIHTLHKQNLQDPDNDNSMITNLEPDILESEVKQALGSITANEASGGDGIPVDLFQILKDDAVKVLHRI